MKSLVRSAALAAALGWTVISATAQTGGTPIESPPVLLPPEKQAIVKEHVKRTKVPLPEIKGPVTVGMAVPANVELFGLPQDTVTEVPTVTRYRFVVSNGIIAVIEPESRKVIQIIKR